MNHNRLMNIELFPSHEMIKSISTNYSNQFLVVGNINGLLIVYTFQDPKVHDPFLTMYMGWSAHSMGNLYINIGISRIEIIEEEKNVDICIVTCCEDGDIALWTIDGKVN